MSSHTGVPAPSSDIQTIGFSGHKDLARLELSTAQLSENLALAAQNWGASPQSPKTLIVGLAEGADCLAIDTWHAHEFGPIIGLGTYTLQSPNYPSEDLLAKLHEYVDYSSSLEGYVSVMNRILSQCDALLVAMEEGAEVKRGGTANVAHRALQLRKPVVNVGAQYGVFDVTP